MSNTKIVEAAERLVLGQYAITTDGPDSQIVAKDRYDVAVAYLRLRGAVQYVIEYANGREYEWGERAEECFRILNEGLEPSE